MSLADIIRDSTLSAAGSGIDAAGRFIVARRPHLLVLNEYHRPGAEVTVHLLTLRPPG